MPVSPENTIIVYRSGDANSEAIADAYVALHGLDDSTNISVNAPTGQKVPITCSAAEILSDEATFNSQVLTPIRNAVSDLETYGTQVWCIVLGMNVPGGFIDGSDVISSTSRISRLHHSFDKKLINNLYDRKTFKLFDADDKDFCLIVSRIDGPSLTIAKSMIEKSAIIKRQLFVNGNFYFDPYSDRHEKGAGAYEDDLLTFQQGMLNKLNLEVWSTTFLDPYVDVIIPSVTDDSFIWSWFSDRGSMSFFKESSAFRCFAYNGDYDGGYAIRSLTDRRWPILCLRNGYAATAGAMSNPTISGMLKADAFFNSLLRSSTLGEAYLYSLPYVDWTMTLFGDPLIKVSFPSQSTVDDETNLTELESWRLMFNDLGRSLAYNYNKTSALSSVLSTIVESTDIELEVDTLSNANAAYNNNDDIRRQGQYSKLTENLLRHISRRIEDLSTTDSSPNLSDYLYNNGIMVSELVYDSQINDNILTLQNISTEGSWELEFTIKDVASNFAYYQFEIDISLTSDFSNIVKSKKTLQDISGWSWEKEKNKFTALTAGGVTSNYAGRRIRYTSQDGEGLNRGDIIYIRFRQRDQSTLFDYETSQDIIFT